MAQVADIDFTRAEVTRSDMLASTASQVDPDIAAALARPDCPDVLLAHPFEVIARLELLRGPSTGSVPVAPPWREAGLPETVAVTDADTLQVLYRRLIVEGTCVQQAQYMSGALLAQLWPQLRVQLPRVVADVWQARFPVLTDGGPP